LLRENPKLREQQADFAHLISKRPLEQQEQKMQEVVKNLDKSGDFLLGLKVGCRVKDFL